MGEANVTKVVYSRSLFEFDREGRTSSLYSTDENMLKYLFKVEHSSEKFCSFFVNLKEQFDYSFVKLTADIRSNIRSLQYLTPTTIRIRFRDEEGDFVNLPFDNCELFKEMLKSGHPVEDRDYTKIHLKVSELDSPANISAALQCGNRPILEAEMQQRVQLRSVPVESDALPIVKRAAPSSLHSKFDSVADEKQSDTQTPLPTRAATTNISPLERYASKLENDVKTQSQKIALLRENINDIDERLSQAKSAQIAGNLTVCVNCKNSTVFDAPLITFAYSIPLSEHNALSVKFGDGIFLQISTHLSLTGECPYLLTQSESLIPASSKNFTWCGS